MRLDRASSNGLAAVAQNAHHVTDTGTLDVASVGVISGATLRAGEEAATLDVYDGTDDSGRLLVALSASAGETAVFTLGQGILWREGLFVAVSGADAVILYTS